MFADRLRLARKRAGLSMPALAERMDPQITAQAIGEYEAGRMMPSSAVLVGLGKALDISLDFLVNSRTDGLDGLELRGHSRASSRERARTEIVLIDILDRYQTIEEILGMTSRGDSFAERHPQDTATESQVDETADKLRDAWDLGVDPMPGLCELLEKKGIKVSEADFPDAVSGLARRFRRLVWRAVGEEMISPVRAAALLNESLDAVERKIERSPRPEVAGAEPPPRDAPPPSLP